MTTDRILDKAVRREPLTRDEAYALYECTPVQELAAAADAVMWLPACPSWLAPAPAAVYLQLLAHEVAVARGCDVDRPRNLAKSVTTE